MIARDSGRAARRQIRRYTNTQIDIQMVDEMMGRLPLCGMILVRVCGHAVEVLLVAPAASPLTGWLAGSACRDARIGRLTAAGSDGRWYEDCSVSTNLPHHW